MLCVIYRTKKYLKKIEFFLTIKTYTNTLVLYTPILTMSVTVRNARMPFFDPESDYYDTSASWADYEDFNEEEDKNVNVESKDKPSVKSSKSDKSTKPVNQKPEKFSYEKYFDTTGKYETLEGFNTFNRFAPLQDLDENDKPKL